MKDHTPGIFILTHDEFQNIDDEIIKESWVAVDELHTYNQYQTSLHKINVAKQVYAVSATLGGRNSMYELQNKGFDVL